MGRGKGGFVTCRRPSTAVSHPAKYSPALKPLLRRLMAGYTPCLDPMAGIGTLGLAGLVHGELEPEWAAQCPQPAIVANACWLPFRDGAFGGVVTSPVYGSRMSDHHDARDASKRYGYRFALGRPLHPDNTGQLQWADSYRAHHEAIWFEVCRVLRPGGRLVLNISDHYRKGVLQPVASWHREHLVSERGLVLVDGYTVPTKRMRNGANAGLRAAHEFVYVMRKP